MRFNYCTHPTDHRSTPDDLDILFKICDHGLAHFAGWESCDLHGLARVYWV